MYLIQVNMTWVKKNREHVKLPAPQLVVTAANGNRLYTPNTLVLAAFEGELRELPVLPKVLSALSGRPALVYRTEDVKVALTPEELQRLVQRALSPTEYFKLRDYYGIAFDWHDDFYDETTGEALQPAI